MTSVRHISLDFLALSMLLVGLTPSLAFAGPPAKWKGNGAFIEVYSTDGCISSYVNASKGGTTAAPQTWLVYHVYDGCTGESLAYGDGQIANTAFKVGVKGATLSVSPQAGASFYTQGFTGAINLTVTPDGGYSASGSGHSEVEYAGHLVKSHGSWSYKTAKVTGSIAGTTVASVYAVTGTSRERSMDIERRSK